MDENTKQVDKVIKEITTHQTGKAMKKDLTSFTAVAVIVALVIMMIVLLFGCRSQPDCSGVYLESDTTNVWVLYYDDSVDHFIIKPR